MREVRRYYRTARVLAVVAVLSAVLFDVIVLLFVFHGAGGGRPAATATPAPPPPVRRIAALTAPDGEALVKEGGLTAAWFDEYGPASSAPAVRAITVAGDLIGVVTEVGEFLVKKGGLTAPWVDELGPRAGGGAAVAGYVYGDPADPSNDRIAVITARGELLAKQGAVA